MQEEGKGQAKILAEERDISPGQEPVSPGPWFIPEGSLLTPHPFLFFTCLLGKNLKRLDKAENENPEGVSCLEGQGQEGGVRRRAGQLLCRSALGFRPGANGK